MNHDKGTTYLYGGQPEQRATIKSVGAMMMREDRTIIRCKIPKMNKLNMQLRPVDDAHVVLTSVRECGLQLWKLKFGEKKHASHLHWSQVTQVSEALFKRLPVAV